MNILGAIGSEFRQISRNKRVGRRVIQEYGSGFIRCSHIAFARNEQHRLRKQICHPAKCFDEHMSGLEVFAAVSRLCATGI